MQHETIYHTCCYKLVGVAVRTLFVQCCPIAFFVQERPFVCVWFKRAMSSLFGNECEASGAILFGIETS
jgi:hypothetical protein